MKSTRKRNTHNTKAVVNQGDSDDSRAGVPQSHSARDDNEPQTQTKPPRIPLAATRVATLPQAVEISLKDGLDEDTLFLLSRAIKAFEATVGVTLSSAELDNAFNLWWGTAKPLLKPDDSRMQHHIDFRETFSRVRTPLGVNPLHQAIKLADSQPWPAEAIPYADDGKEIGRLIATCFHLQGLSGDDPFFLGLRDAAVVLNTTSQVTAGKRMNGLCVLGILTCTWKAPAGGKKASRYRYNHKG